MSRGQDPVAVDQSAAAEALAQNAVAGLLGESDLPRHVAQLGVLPEVRDRGRLEVAFVDPTAGATNFKDKIQGDSGSLTVGLG